MRLNEEVARRLEVLRVARGVSTDDIETHFMLGEGWWVLIKSGDWPLGIDFVAAVLQYLDGTLDDVLGGVDLGTEPFEMTRRLSVTTEGRDLVLHFPYGEHRATYRLPSAARAEFERWFGVFRKEVAVRKSDAIANGFLAATRLWPSANPADLWYFLLHNAYCDPLNHPPGEVDRDFEQSWKRSSGWALERAIVEHYEPHLARSGVHLVMPRGRDKQALAKQLKVPGRVETDKIDIFLIGDHGDSRVPFGAMHVKASFAERRTDDQPLSQALIAAGYVSPFWTLDCKAIPGPNPINRGELGTVLGRGVDTRSAKRKDFEDDGYFSACFSYNTNTLPTPEGQRAKARVYACKFNSPDDKFPRWLIGEWGKFRRAHLGA